MPNFLENRNTNIFSKKAKYIYKRAMEKFQRRPLKTKEMLMQDMISAMEWFFSSIGSSLLSRNSKVSDGSIPTTEAWDTLTNDIVADISAVYDAQNGIATNIHIARNNPIASRSELAKKMGVARSDMARLDNTFVDQRSGSIIFEDEFSSFSNSDSSTTATIDVGTNTLYLNKKASVDISDRDNISDIITVVRAYPIGGGETEDPSSPEVDEMFVDPTIDSRGIGFYKGFGVYPIGHGLSSDDGIWPDPKYMEPLYKPHFAILDSLYDTLFEVEMVLLDGNIRDGDTPIIRSISIPRDELVDIRGRDIIANIPTDAIDKPTDTIFSEDLAVWIWNQIPVVDAATGYVIEGTIYITFTDPISIFAITGVFHTYNRQLIPNAVIDVLVIDGEMERWEELSTPTETTETIAWIVGDVTVKQMRIKLKQSTSYPIAYSMITAKYDIGWQIQHYNLWGGESYRSDIIKHKGVYIDCFGEEFQQSIGSKIRENLEGLTSIINPAASYDAMSIAYNNYTSIHADIAIEPAMLDVGTIYNDRATVALRGIVSRHTEYTDIIEGLNFSIVDSSTTPTLTSIFPYLDPDTSEPEFVTIPSSASNRHRYVIGLRSLSFSLSEYETRSVYNSIRYTSPFPIKYVRFEVDDFIPDDIIRYASTQNPVPRFIEYKVSIGGSQYYDIAPIGTPILADAAGVEIPHTYIINTPEDQEIRDNSSGVQYLYFENAVSDVSIQIIIKRPSVKGSSGIDTFANITPIIQSYRLITDVSLSPGEV